MSAVMNEWNVVMRRLFLLIGSDVLLLK